MDPADAPVGVVAGDPHLAAGRLEPAIEELGQLKTVGVDGAVRLQVRDPCFQQSLGGLLARRLDHLGGLRVLLLLAALRVQDGCPSLSNAGSDGRFTHSWKRPRTGTRFFLTG